MKQTILAEAIGRKPRLNGEFKMQIRDIMTLHPVTAGEETCVAEAFKILNGRHIHHLPVTRPLPGGGQEVAGIITERNLLSTRSVFLGTKMEEPKDTLTLGIHLKGIMVKHVITLPPDAPVKDAVRLMREKNIGCIPVVDGRALVGIVTGRDMLKVLWEFL